MQRQITDQAGTIREYAREIDRLERENVMLSERIGELEARLHVCGALNEDGSFRDDAELVMKTASIVLAKLEELR